MTSFWHAGQPCFTIRLFMISEWSLSVPEIIITWLPWASFVRAIEDVLLETQVKCNRLQITVLSKMTYWWFSLYAWLWINLERFMAKIWRSLVGRRPHQVDFNWLSLSSLSGPMRTQKTEIYFLWFIWKLRHDCLSKKIRECKNL